MAFELITFVVLLAVATAIPQAYNSAPGYDQAAPVYTQSVKAVDADYDSNPEYSFSYEVHDEHSGDIKSHQETRHGDAVKGSYSLIEADGTRRIVEYKVDQHSGFNAIVRNEGVSQTPVVTNYVTKPVPQEPVSQAAPVAQISFNHDPTYEYHH